jgi:hypothetical protein
LENRSGLPEGTKPEIRENLIFQRNLCYYFCHQKLWLKKGDLFRIGPGREGPQSVLQTATPKAAALSRLLVIDKELSHAVWQSW